MARIYAGEQKEEKGSPGSRVHFGLSAVCDERLIWRAGVPAAGISPPVVAEGKAEQREAEKRTESRAEGARSRTARRNSSPLRH